MTLAAGTRLGPYELIASIGAGGMGEVWKARDTRLDRIVAVKIMLQHASADAAQRERFEREARAVSSLSHPHICALYDVGNQDGVEYLVMEYLEGQTLADRLAAGPLPLDKVFEYGAQIASALDWAHRRGVVHRDLKPGNIMLTKSGAKLLDFGLAKLEPARATPLNTITLTKPLTAAGAILGTFQYMAPEQIEGKEADARSDVFALGVVLYEMATGRKAFEGKTQASVMVGILEHDPPPIATLQPVTPPAFEQVVKTCMAKDPDERRQCAHDVLLELKWIADTWQAKQEPEPARAKSKQLARLGWIVAALVLLAAGALALVHFREAPPEHQVLRYTIAQPPKTTVDSLAISPDGRYLAIEASGDSGRQLWLRALDAVEPQLLKGTEDARFPFWSPDSRHIAFFADGKLKRIAVTAGPPQTVCAASTGRGGSWGRDGVIVFSPSNSGSLYRVPAAGGEPVALKLDGTNPRFPAFLPDGRFLYMSVGEAAGIYLASLDSRQNRRLNSDRSSPQYVAPAAGRGVGHVLVVRDGTLIAQPVNPESLQPAGELFPVAEQVGTSLASGTYGRFSISETGVLVYAGGGNSSTAALTWFDRSGKELGTVGSAMASFLALSPDGKRVLASRVAPQGATSDLWLIDLERGTESRFTFDASYNGYPVWSPDASQVVFASSRAGRPNLYRKAANGTGQEERLLKSEQIQFPRSWSRDGKFILFESIGDKTRYDIFALPAGGGKPVPLLQSQFNERDPVVSPDGRWLAYVSDETGRSEVYVQPFTAGAAAGKPAAGKWQVSKEGGIEPRWRADGRELYFAFTNGKVMAVDITPGDTFRAGTPKVLFTAIVGGLVYYDVTGDGKRFLVARTAGEAPGAQPITVVVNWLAGIRR